MQEARGVKGIGLACVSCASRRRLPVVFSALVLLSGLDTVVALGPPGVTGLRRTDVKPAAPPQCTLSVSPASLPAGGSAPSTLTWTSTNAFRVTLNGGTVAASGVLTVQPVTTATYRVIAEGGPETIPATCVKVISISQPPCANGTICPIACGTGMIPDIRTGQLLTLDHQHMVHVLLLAEGYTAADLPRFHLNASNDVNDWMDQWGRLDIFDTFREAFCFWKLPAVSNARIVAGGLIEDTAFRVPVDSSGEVDLSDVTATSLVADRVWREVAKLPFPSGSFYPTTGSRTRGMAKNVVVAAMLYETARNASGYSGTTTLLTNPSNANQTVAAAFAHNRPHEFAHAFARLRDEYIDLDGNQICAPRTGAWSSANVSNVACEQTCSGVPWSHLVAGGAINPALGGLVGAFGHAEDGYHAELKCLMNGTHDNATVYGGESDLRTPERMCNFCRELSAFRLFERIGRLSDTSTSYATWQSQYRLPFYSVYGLDVPPVVPMETPPGTPVFVPCVPP
jgi:hypothetical protein